MYSYSFAIKIINQKINGLDFTFDKVEVEEMGDGVILFKKHGFPTEEVACEKMYEQFFKFKMFFLEREIPHLDWFCLDFSLREFTRKLNRSYPRKFIAVHSYEPLVYEEGKNEGWHGAEIGRAVDLSDLGTSILSEEIIDVADANVFEALTVLTLAVSEPFPKSKLILSMTVIEILSGKQKKQSNSILTAIDHLKDEVRSMTIDTDVKDKLVNILNNGRKESISSKCYEFIKSTLGESDANDFKKIYNARSKNVHGDNTIKSWANDSELVYFSNKAYSLAFRLISVFVKGRSSD